VIPLYGFLEGDTLGLVVTVMGEDTVDELAAKLRAAAAVRAGWTGPARVVFKGRTLLGGTTVQAAGIEALDMVEVRPLEASS
jgi:hypothetical protein